MARPLSQQQMWDNEYVHRSVVVQQEARVDVKKFFRWLRRKQHVSWDGVELLDSGCGTGSASRYASDEGARVIGIDISRNALEWAERESVGYPSITYQWADISQPLPFHDHQFSVILDVMTSHCLVPSQMDQYAQELSRCIRPGGFLLLRTFAREGDRNAQTLLQQSPGPEISTYCMPQTGIVERVDTQEDILRRFSNKLWQSHELKKVSHYQRVQGRLYKRNYWVGWFERRRDGDE